MPTKPKITPKAAPSKSNGDDAPAAPLPPSLVQALPVSRMLVGRLKQLTDEFEQLERELSAARKMGAIPLARAYVVLHRVMDKIDRDMKPLRAIYDNVKTAVLPELFEQDGVTSVPLAEGFRVGVSYTTRASIREGMRDKAYTWLKKNGMGELITTTVNASTLSATARQMLEEDNRELPDNLFNVARMPNTSVTKTG